MTTAIDSHIHWFPNRYYEFLAARGREPTAVREGDSWRYVNGKKGWRLVPEWNDLEMQFETVSRSGMDMTVISSGGVHSNLEDMPVAEAREGARIMNEEWSAAQRRYPGRFFAAALVPLVDTDAAIEELDYAIDKLDLRGVSLPGSIAGENLDAPRLQPFYAHVEKRGIPIFLHPTDGMFTDVMEGYDGGLYRSLGRVVDSSAAVMRLILSGTLDRHPDLRIFHFHAGGVLPYAAGRLDKNSRVAALAEQPTWYLKRMWVDTAMPHSLTIGMAIDFYGADRVLYGSDNPCWNPMAALEATRALNLGEVVERKVLDTNARELFNLTLGAAA